MSHKLPGGPRKRTPGAGLKHMFPVQEGPTGKMRTIASAKERCPKCGGTTLLSFERVGEPDRLPTVREFGIYRYTPCDLCVDGYVSAVEADAYRTTQIK